MNLKIKPFFCALMFLIVATSCHAEVLLKDLRGNNIPFSSLKGKWVLLNYWAGWCTTCLEEIPELNQFYRKHEKDSVALFAVNYDALPVYKQNYLVRKLDIQYPSLAVDPASALGLGGIAGIPVTFIFNPAGELVKTLYGGQDTHSLELAIAQK